MDGDREETPSEHPAPELASTGEVAAVVERVQRKRRSRIHWGIGKHTAELALRALDDPARRRPRSSKSRRRKRFKRLL